MQRTASARWHGGAQDGSGTLTTQSGTLKDVPFTFKARFGDAKGTNPEELIAVAYAGCLSMALSFALGNAEQPPQSIKTNASPTLDKVEGDLSSTAIHLTSCPESKVLEAAITLDAALA